MYRHEDYVGAITLVNEGKVHLRPLISKVFAFKDYLKAYQYIDANRETNDESDYQMYRKNKGGSLKKRRHPGGVFFFVMETRKKISLAFCAS